MTESAIINFNLYDIMEQLNRIELRGTVGNIKTQEISGANVANFTVATNLAYRDKDGCAIIETTWHNVTTWESKDIQNLDRIEKGSKVHVVGRIRNQRFCGSDGVERTMCEVVARAVELIDEQEVLQYQM